MGNELSTVQELLGQVRSELEEANDRSAVITESLGEQNRKLAAVEKKLPDFLPRTRFRQTLVIGGLTLVLTLGGAVTSIVFATHRTACPVRGILVLARTSSTRNPIPPGLPPETVAAIEAGRRDAQQFYDDAIGSLTIFWPCGGPKPQVRQ